MSNMAHSESESVRWPGLLGRIRSLQIELQRSGRDRKLGLSGNPGAPASAIRIAELRLATSLPPSYQQFLLFTNGWPCFFEEADLLGTADIGRPSCLNAHLRGPAQPPHPLMSLPDFKHFLPFGASPDGETVFAFDTRVPPHSGEMPVVAWIGGLGLDCRNFTEFLATVLQLCRTEAAERKAQNKSPQIASTAKAVRRRRGEVLRSGTHGSVRSWRCVG